MKLLSSMTNEEIEALSFERLNFLMKYESALNDLRKEKEKIRTAKGYFQHCLKLSDANPDIAKRFFMESIYALYADEVFSETEEE